MKLGCLAFGFIALILLTLLTACQPKGNECTTEKDCVQQWCCHSSKCVAKETAPHCEQIVCSEECLPRTLDCAQGYCDCVNGYCKAILI